MRLAAIFALAMVAAPLAAQEISSAVYSEPTKRYPHGVLGDDEEWGTLAVTVTRRAGSKAGLFNGQSSLTYNFTLPEELVFEDTAPRLWDVTGDGQPEVVVVQSHTNYGARLVIIGLSADAKPELIASTPFIGQASRWLAPVGAADFDGDGSIEIAYVDRPHLAKTLRVWRLHEGELREIATLKGVSNHRIGEAFISGGVRHCNGPAEMILASADWEHIVAVRWNDSGLTKQKVGALSGPDSIKAAMRC